MRFEIEHFHAGQDSVQSYRLPQSIAPVATGWKVGRDFKGGELG